MVIDVQPGRYVVAVSGGVDSMTLLHLLAQRLEVQRQGLGGESYGFVVAHYDHGIRPDSAEDRQAVQAAARHHGLPFVHEEGHLGADASENIARQARYDFLRRTQLQHGASAIITAHHQDDVLETAIINLLRGTGRRGLTSLGSTTKVLRPLLQTRKQDILDYAAANGLVWREDSTNADDRYLRNYIRHHVLPKFDARTRQQLLGIIEQSRTINHELDKKLFDLLGAHANGQELNRRAFQQLPHAVAKEVLATWLRQHGVANFDAHTLERVTITAKTQRPGAIIDIIGGASLVVTKDSLALYLRER